MMIKFTDKIQPMSDSQINASEEQKDFVVLTNHYTDIPISSSSSIRLPQSQSQQSYECLIERPNLSKKLMLKQISSQKLKKNLLQSKYSQRMRKLKEVTRTNLQMFLRIQSQQSHYSLKKTEFKENKTQQIEGKDKEKTECGSIADRPKTYRLRCKSANLLRKCEELKETIVKERPSGAMSSFTTTFCEAKKDEYHKNIKIVRVASAFNKENQTNNSSNHLQSCRNNDNFQKKILQKKLCFQGNVILPFKQKRIQNPRFFLKKENIENQIQSKVNKINEFNNNHKQGITERILSKKI